jgi:HD-GYP domain-containing protein (c-di-GMP phosphodiesterase class II)
LQAERIPTIGRIVAVADAYDAMTTDRAYRKALPHVIACGEMERCSGTQFDPDIVRVFFGHIEDYRKLIPMMMFILGAPKEKPRSRSPGVLAYVP